eukprot:scaffold218269_cov39-Tisochrysis_lutea.AAC.3
MSRAIGSRVLAAYSLMPSGIGRTSACTFPVADRSVVNNEHEAQRVELRTHMHVALADAILLPTFSIFGRFALR